MYRLCQGFLASLLFCGCASMPSQTELKGIAKNSSDKAELALIKIDDARARGDRFVRTAQGQLLEESSYSPSSLEFVRTVMCDAGCPFFAARALKLHRLEIGLGTGLKLGSVPNGPAYIPIGVHPGAILIGNLLGQGLVALASSSRAMTAHVVVTLEIDGKVVEAQAAAENGSKTESIAFQSIYQATYEAIAKIRSGVEIGAWPK